MYGQQNIKKLWNKYIKIVKYCDKRLKCLEIQEKTLHFFFITM